MIKTLAIVGARFRPPAKEILDNLPSNAKLILRRQPDNPYDSNAVQVCLWMVQELPETVLELLMIAEYVQVNADRTEMAPFHLGFIPRDEAAGIAPLMDAEIEGAEVYTEQLSVWPALLTFLPSGQPGVKFEIPNGGE